MSTASNIAEPAAPRVGRASACSDASRREFEARTADTPPDERARQIAEFNRQLGALVQAGRFPK